MDEILTRLTTSITSFKANPNKEVKAAGDQPFCVLTNNRPAFYVLSPAAWEQLEELIWDLDATPEILRRKEEHARTGKTIKVSIDDLLAGKPIPVDGDE